MWRSKIDSAPCNACAKNPDVAYTRHGKRRITVRVDGIQHEFHVDARLSPREIEKAKARLRVRVEQDLPTATTGTLAGDAVLYLDTLKHRPQLRKEREHHLDFWIARFGTRARSALKPAELSAALSELRETKSASHCNHVRIALSHLFSTLDGKSAPNPIRDVQRFEEPEPEPKALDYALIDRVLGYITRQWGKKGRKRPQKTKARLKVMACTGWAPAQIKRIKASDLRLEHAAVFLRRRLKGKGVAGSLIPVSPSAALALRELVEANALGPWSTSAANKAWQRACKKAMAHPDTTEAEAEQLLHSTLYDLRHSFGTYMFQQTGNLHTTGELMVHRDPRTTRRYTLAAVPAHLRAAVQGAPRLNVVPAGGASVSFPTAKFPETSTDSPSARRASTRGRK